MKEIKLVFGEVQEIQSAAHSDIIKDLCADWIEFADRNEKLALAASINYDIAELRAREIEALQDDAGAEIHDTIARHKTPLTAADALVEAVANHIADIDDPHTLVELCTALREYREAGDG